MALSTGVCDERGNTVSAICRSGEWYPTGTGSDGDLGNLEGFLEVQPQLSLEILYDIGKQTVLVGREEQRCKGGKAHWGERVLKA